MAKGFHNTTAKFNAYFLCKERMLTIDKKLRENHTDDYNQILHLYPSIDSNFTKGFDSDFQYINERAILIPGKHKNAHLVDDAYILMGRVKMYRMKLDSAEKFFRYVNNTFEDPQGLQASQLYLLQTFMLSGHKQNARLAHELIIKQPPLKKNNLLYNKTIAEYYRNIGKHKKMIPFLEEAVKYERTKDERARVYYILGQLYEQEDNDEEAFHYFVNAQKRNPPYILEFNAKLSAIKVSPRKGPKDRKRLARTLKKLKKDPNNEEYLDRIYYEVAMYYQKHKQVDSTLVNLERSIAASKNDALQKGYAFYQSAETYFNDIDYLESTGNSQRSHYYVQSKLYYDSTLTTVDSTFKWYEHIIERQEILDRFVKELLIVEKEDSLLAWADMDSTTLAALIEELAIAEQQQLVAAEQARRDQIKEERALAKAATQGTSTGGFYEPNAVTSFKFYNPVAIENSKIAFTQKWGNRLLENNWRRSNKEMEFEDEEEEEYNDSSKVVPTDSLGGPIVEQEEVKEDLETPIDIHVDRSKYYADIPYTADQKEAAYAKIENALYLLGKIYNNELNEKEYAIEAFLRHEEYYNDSKNRAEVLYTLALLCTNSEICNRETYVNKLHKEYPHSKYTKLIDNPTYVADYQVKNQEARSLYNNAFNFYKSGYYAQCDKTLRELNKLYPNNDIQDKVDFLSILILAKKDRMYTYKKELKNFLEVHKTSDVIPYAQKLYTDYNTKNTGVSVETLTYSSDTTSASYYIISVYSQDSMFVRPAAKAFNEEFLATYYRDVKFDIKQVELNEQFYIYTIKSLNTREEARTFLTKFKKFAKFKEVRSNYTFHIISKENYQVLINTEDVTGYRTKFKNRN